MQVTQKEKNGVTVLSLGGEVTINTTEELTKIFKKNIANKTRKVVVDLGKLEYIDSSGLACLIRFSRDLQKIQGVLFFCSLSPKIRSIFAITRLEDAFKVYDTEEEALREIDGY